MDMYCGGCNNITFWRWLKRNDKFSLSVTCNDYDGEYLYYLQPNNVTGCFGEYLCTWFGKGYQMYRKYIKRIDLFFYENDLSPFMKPFMFTNILPCHMYIVIYTDKSIVRSTRASIPR